MSYHQNSQVGLLYFIFLEPCIFASEVQSRNYHYLASSFFNQFTSDYGPCDSHQLYTETAVPPPLPLRAISRDSYLKESEMLSLIITAICSAAVFTLYLHPLLCFSNSFTLFSISLILVLNSSNCWLTELF